MARPPAIERETSAIAVFDIRNVGLTDEQFLRLCRDNEILSKTARNWRGSSTPSKTER